MKGHASSYRARNRVRQHLDRTRVTRCVNHFRALCTFATATAGSRTGRPRGRSCHIGCKRARPALARAPQSYEAPVDAAEWLVIVGVRALTLEVALTVDSELLPRLSQAAGRWRTRKQLDAAYVHTGSQVRPITRLLAPGRALVQVALPPTAHKMVRHRERTSDTSHAPIQSAPMPGMTQCGRQCGIACANDAVMPSLHMACTRREQHVCSAQIAVGFRAHLSAGGCPGCVCPSGSAAFGSVQACSAERGVPSHRGSGILSARAMGRNAL